MKMTKEELRAIIHANPVRWGDRDEAIELEHRAVALAFLEHYDFEVQIDEDGWYKVEFKFPEGIFEGYLTGLFFFRNQEMNNECDC